MDVFFVCVCLIHAVGTFKMKDPQTIKTVINAALENGYRLIGQYASFRKLYTNTTT